MSNKKITDMVALTTPASDDVLPIVDISETAAADKNKKISIEELFKGVPNGTAAAPSVAFEFSDGSGIFLAGTNTIGITTAGTQRVTVDGSGNVTIDGDLTVNGATTTIDATSLIVEDKNIEMGVVSTPTNTTADGGGITLKGATDKTITWVDSTGCWTFNQPTNFNNHVRIDSSGSVGIGTSTPGVKLAVAGTDAIQVPAGTTAQRPTAAAGQIRLNTTHGYYEGYDGTNWTNLRTLVQSYLPSGTQACDSTTLTTIDVIENNESYGDSLTTESAGVYTFARAGVYEIYIRLTVEGNANNYRWTSRLRATKNGTSTVVGEVEGGYLRGSVASSRMCFVAMAFTHQFAASDTLTFQIQRITDTSGSATIQVEGTNIIIKALKTTD